MSTTIQKLRIYAMLMRIQEIQESKIRRIQHIEGRLRSGKILAIGMDFGSTESQTVECNYPFKTFEIKSPEIFEPNLYYNSDKEHSKYFGKPKNNFRK